MIDWQQVETLRGEIGDDDFDEVVGMFLEEVEGVLDDLRNRKNDQTLEGALHALTSSALNLGFSRFAELCASGEAQAADGGAVDLEPIFAAYQASKTVFEAARA